MPIRCSKCGIESPLVSAFHRLQITRRISRWYCPPCAGRRTAANNSLWLIAAVLAVPLGLMLLRLDSPGQKYGWHLLTFALFVVFQAICIVPHELGHAVTALILGMRLFNVCIGACGKVAFVIRVLGYDVVFMTIPLGGTTLATPKSTRFVRFKEFLLVLSGPMANAVLIVVAVWLGQHVAGYDVAKWGVTVFVYANLFVLALNLFPQILTLNGQRIPSDGRQLLSIPFLSSDRIRELHASYFTLEGLEARERGNLESAQAWFEQGLAAYPDDVACSSGLGTVLLDVADYPRAKQIFERLLEQKKDDMGLGALFKNNIAWTDLLIGDRQLLDEADRFSSEAIEVLPWVSEIKGTRGSVLIELGRIEDGVSLVEQAMKQNRQRQNQAFNASYLALAMLRLGNLEKAADYQKAAVRLDPKCALRNRLEVEKEKLRDGARRA